MPNNEKAEASVDELDRVELSDAELESITGGKQPGPLRFVSIPTTRTR